MTIKTASRELVLAAPVVDDRAQHSANRPNPQIDTQRSLFAHPHAVSGSTTPITDEIKTQIAERLHDCLQDNKPMVSFHSPRGYQKCKNLFDANALPPHKEPQRPSLLQYCLQARANKQTLEITIDAQKYSVELDDLHFEDGGESASSPVQHMKGKFLLKPNNPSQETKTIHFVEMSPPFDGYALSADDLIQCAAQMALIRQKEQKYHGFKGQFSSANGICRSASLLVVDQFNEFLASATSLPQDFDVHQKVKSLVDELRKGHQRLIPHDTQVEALKQACSSLFRRHQSQSEHAATVPQEQDDARSSELESSEVGTVPDLIEISALEGEGAQNLNGAEVATALVPISEKDIQRTITLLSDLPKLLTDENLPHEDNLTTLNLSLSTIQQEIDQLIQSANQDNFAEWKSSIQQAPLSRSFASNVTQFLKELLMSCHMKEEMQTQEIANLCKSLAKLLGLLKVDAVDFPEDCPLLNPLAANWKIKVSEIEELAVKGYRWVSAGLPKHDFPRALTGKAKEKFEFWKKISNSDNLFDNWWEGCMGFQRNQTLIVDYINQTNAFMAQTN